VRILEIRATMWRLSVCAASSVRNLDYAASHEASFERTGASRVGSVSDLAALLRRTLKRIRSIAEAFHLVLHTSPNSHHQSKRWVLENLEDDYHWHIEILPVVAAKARSYTFKEVYYSPVTSETA